MSGGATSYAASMSAPVGAMSVAPGTKMRSPIVVSMLDAVAMRPDGWYFASVSAVNVWTNSMTSSVNTLGAVT